VNKDKHACKQAGLVPWKKQQQQRSQPCMFQQQQQQQQQQQHQEQQRQQQQQAKGTYRQSLKHSSLEVIIRLAQQGP
jgi:hypothetical protein